MLHRERMLEKSEHERKSRSERLNSPGRERGVNAIEQKKTTTVDVKLRKSLQFRDGRSTSFLITMPPAGLPPPTRSADRHKLPLQSFTVSPGATRGVGLVPEALIRGLNQCFIDGVARWISGTARPPAACSTTDHAELRAEILSPNLRSIYILQIMHLRSRDGRRFGSWIHTGIERGITVP